MNIYTCLCMFLHIYTYLCMKNFYTNTNANFDYIKEKKSIYSYINSKLIFYSHFLYFIIFFEGDLLKYYSVFHIIACTVMRFRVIIIYLFDIKICKNCSKFLLKISINTKYIQFSPTNNN